MNETTSNTITGIKYVYLIVFFALLSGFFHPLITGQPFESVVAGVFVLLIGLVGGILIYKAIMSLKYQKLFFITGFGLIALSLTLVFLLSGRI